MELTGEMREAELFGENLVLRRKITSKLGEPSVRIQDEIENEGCEDEQTEENVGHRPAVPLEKQLRFVHCFAEGFLLGDVLLCHIAYSCY